MFQRLVEQAARSLGLEFVAVQTIATGLAQLRSTAVDIVLVDGLLPDGMGIDVVRAVREMPTPQPRVVFISAFFRDLKAFQTLRALGVAKILHKPIASAELRFELESLAAGLLRKSPPSGDDFAAKLQELANEYGAHLAQQAEEIEVLIGVRGPNTEGPTSGSHPASMPAQAEHEKLRSLVHRIAGTAGSYGYGLVSDAASVLDQRLTSGEPSGALHDDLLALAARMRDATTPSSAPAASPASARWLHRLLLVSALPAEHTALLDELARHGVDVRLAGDIDALVSELVRSWPDVVLVDDRIRSPRLTSVLRCLPEPVHVLTVAGGAKRGGTGELRSASALFDALAELSPPLHGCSVRVVDDDLVVANRVRELLAPMGVRTIHAQDVEQFASAVATEIPALMLVSTALPGYSGFGLARSAKAERALRDIPLLLLGELSSAQDRSAAYDAGADGLVGKPIVAKELVTAVTSRLRSDVMLRSWVAMLTKTARRP